MAVGDDALAAGFPIVQPSDMIEQGYLEVNRTRDMVANVLALIPAIWPTNQGGTGASDIAAAKVNLGISYGTDDPSDAVGGNVDGNIYLKITSS